MNLSHKSKNIMYVVNTFRTWNGLQFEVREKSPGQTDDDDDIDLEKKATKDKVAV